MAVQDIRQVCIDPRMQTPHLTNGGPSLTPINSQSFITVQIPKNKLNKSIVAIKFLNSSMRFMNNSFDKYSIVDSALTSSWKMCPMVAGTPGTIITFLFPSTIISLPTANPWGLVPDPIAAVTQDSFTLAIQNYINNRITVLGLDAEHGGANAYQVAWVFSVPDPFTNTTNGYYIFTNIYGIQFQMDFSIHMEDGIDAPKSVGPVFGFGYSITEYNTTHISMSTRLCVNGVRPSDPTVNTLVSTLILIVADLIVDGIDNGIIIMDGTQSPPPIISIVQTQHTIPDININQIAFNRPNTNYIQIKQSHLFWRISDKIYGPWENTPIPPTLSTDMQTDNPFFRLWFLTMRGSAIRHDLGLMPMHEGDDYWFGTDLHYLLSFTDIDKTTVRIL
jgi:hypothetical protein